MNDDEIENTDFYVIVPSEKNKEIKLGFQKCCLLLYSTKAVCIIARFIWNAEISVSIAIHCYERLF